MSLNATYFEQLFTADPDPWALSDRWYEQRKRALTLAALTRQRYARAFEPACANGDLSALLAPRCEHLLCMDASATATQLTCQRLHGQPQVEVRQGHLPADWPEGEFELIVLSEFGYYLDSRDWAQVIDQAQASLSPQGSLLACHFLRPMAECPQTGQQVHEQLQARLDLVRVMQHREADFLLELWCREPGGLDLEEPCL